VGIDRARLLELFWLLQVPSPPYRLHSVISNLHEILEEAQNTWIGILKGWELDWLPKLLVSLMPIAKELQSQESPSKNAAQHSTGIADSDPKLPGPARTIYSLYAALTYEGCHDRDGDLHHLYRKLQAHFLLAYIKQVRKEQTRPPKDRPLPPSWPELKFKSYYPGLAVRDLRGNQKEAETEQVLTTLPLGRPPHEFAEQVRNTPLWITENKGTWVYDCVRYIGVFVEQAYGIKGRRTTAARPTSSRSHVC
jgi:hypothetical protein